MLRASIEAKADKLAKEFSQIPYWQDRMRSRIIEEMTALLEEQRKKHVQIAWDMQMREFGGGTAIGNAINECF